MRKIVRAAPADRNILFVPDQNLGAWVMEQTGAKWILWQGNSYHHVEFTARAASGRIRERRSGVPVVAHPGCTYAVRNAGGRGLFDGNGDASARNLLQRKSSS